MSKIQYLPRNPDWRRTVREFLGWKVLSSWQNLPSYLTEIATKANFQFTVKYLVFISLVKYQSKYFTEIGWRIFGSCSDYSEIGMKKQNCSMIQSGSKWGKCPFPSFPDHRENPDRLFLLVLVCASIFSTMVLLFKRSMAYGVSL